jgi:hypothetical protein
MTGNTFNAPGKDGEEVDVHFFYWQGLELVPDLPVVMVATGSEKQISHGSAAEIRESLRATSLAYMVKPVGRNDLLHV